MKKKLYHHSDLRTALIEEALRFLKKGRAEDLSLREIARRLDVSHMAPYRHFSNKEDLIAAIIEEGFIKLTERFNAVDAMVKKNKFSETLNLYGRTYVEFFIQHPDQSRLMFSGLLCDPSKHETAHKAGQETFMKLVNLIQRGQDEGFIKKKDNPFMVGLMIWSSVHGTAMLMLEDQFKMIDNAPAVQADIFMNFMTEKLLKGLQ